MGGLLKTGASVSSTVMVRLTELALPHSSVKVHVRVTTKLFGQSPGVTTSTGTPVIMSLQLSTAVNSIAAGTSSAHCTAIGAGASGATGASVSSTVMV